MRAPAFWSDPDSRLGLLLQPLGALVGALTLRRMAQPGAKAPVPVLCIGNPTVGGAGKTPTAQWFAQRLAAAGHRPAILTRGYGGRLKGPVVVEAEVHQAGDVGDEALLHARQCLTVVSQDRPAGAALARDKGADIIVMDDGFQNPSLTKDLSLLVVDGAAGLGNGRVLPAGPLRAPFQAQLDRAGALMIVGRGAAGDALAREAAGARILTATIGVTPHMRDWLDGRDVLAFCGIGRPAKFAETLGAAGARNALLRPFPDHHGYREADAARLLAEAKATGLPLVTTEKDAVKLRGSPGLDALRAAATMVPITLVPDDPAACDAFLAPLQAPLGFRPG